MSSGILPFESIKHQTNLNTGFFECSAYTEDDQMFTCSGDHDGAGMSGGNLQYNFGWANHLTTLYRYMVNNHEQLCINAFGANTTEYNTWKTAVLSAVQQDRLDFGAAITDPNNAHAIKEPYKTALGTIQISDECKAEYYRIRDVYYWDIPFRIFNTLSCTSRLALASFFDIYINRGRYYPLNMLVNDFEAIDNDPALTDDQKESQKIILINDRGNQTENSMTATQAEPFWERRNCMRNQGGMYWGLAYDPETQFDMNLEPGSEVKAEGTGIKLGSIDVKNIFLGTQPIKSIYLGAELLGGGGSAYSYTLPPVTQFRTNPGSYEGIGSATAISITAGAPIWIDCTPPNFIPCKTYYTTDGSEPTEASTLYGVNGTPIILNSSCTLKVKSVSLFGIWEATKTLTVSVASAPVTTISPAATVQNAIPITVTLTTSEPGAAIKYRLGTSTTVYNYTAPFTVNQNSPGVASTQIKITYWAVGASATEAEKTLTYNTSGAIPGTPVVTATPGINQVALTWDQTINTTSYSVFRSEVAGTPGTALSQWKSENYFTDLTAVPGVTYYYTVQAGNYQTHTDTVISATALEEPAAPTKPSYRYIKFEGLGSLVAGAEWTTRAVELEIFSGGINVVKNKPILSSQAVSTGTGTAAMMIDGNKALTTNTYPIWWSQPPNGNVVIDLGAVYPIDSLTYTSLAYAGETRVYRFRILGSNTNNGTDWTDVWDMSANNDPIPATPGGYTTTL